MTNLKTFTLILFGMFLHVSMASATVISYDLSDKGPGALADPERVTAVGEDPLRIKLDKAGYFVINIEDERMLVEHYDYKEHLLRVIEGDDARSIYLTIVRNEWVSRLDHAAYLGRQLTKAEYQIRHAVPFVQDGA